MSSKLMGGARALNEMKEFAVLSPGAQRYICRSLDVAHDRQPGSGDGGQDPGEARAYDKQRRIYARLADIRRALPDELGAGDAEFLGNLILVACHDLAQAKLDSFCAFRFLYERLLGAAIRPWLPAAFCGAASLPQIHPSQRAALLKSITEAAATAAAWSEREPVFFPDWVALEDASAR